MIVRRDFAFVAFGQGLRASPGLTASFEQSLRRKGFSPEAAFETAEFLVFYPLTPSVFAR